MALVDSIFYGLAAETVAVRQAISRSSSPATVDARLKYIMDAPDEPNPRAQATTPDPTLLGLENLMIREFFSLPFVYQPLDGRSTIRLLVLHLGSPCEPLRGTIQHATVTAGRIYEAISYTWGGDSKPCSARWPGVEGFNRFPLPAMVFESLDHSGSCSST